MKREKLDNLEVGKRYYVESGIWKMNNMMYVGLMPIMQCNGKIKYNPMFTCGDLEIHQNNINIHTSKSNIKAYKID